MGALYRGQSYGLGQRAFGPDQRQVVGVQRLAAESGVAAPGGQADDMAVGAQHGFGEVDDAVSYTA